MKKTARILALGLIVVTLLSLSVAALAENLTVYIPNRVVKLDLPGYENARYDEYTYDGDPFRTGQEGGETTVYWEQVRVPGHKFVFVNGAKVEKYAEYDTLYIPRVRTTYPKGNYIRKIEANFRNDAARSLVDYLITYQTSDTEKYTVRYAAANVTILETHEYETTPTGGKITKNITFSKWDGKPISAKLNDNQFLHRYYQDQILEGWYDADGEMTLKSGSGKNFQKWYRWEYWTGKVVQVYKRGLKPVTAFKSPRVQ